jgi:hypothetical protein
VEEAPQGIEGAVSVVVEASPGEAHLAHRRLLEEARLGFTEDLEAKTLGVGDQVPQGQNIAFDRLRRGVERVRLGVTESVDAVDQLVGGRFGGYLNSSAPSLSRERLGKHAES